MNIKKIIGALAIILFTGWNLAAQEEKRIVEPQGDLIKAMYYYEDGNIKQEGTYKNAKLHGKWISYEQNGKKNAIAYYTEGRKTGTWFFWSQDILTEVEYADSRVAEVKKYKNTGSLVIRD